jgi:1-acyl-sn-glycerol-3-phosphate acyltransferase
MLSPLTRRRLRALAKESLFELPPLGWVIASLGAFPVQRDGADRESMRVARELLADGNLLLVFPEGTRRFGPVVLAEEMHAGPAFVATRSGVPIVPMGIAGTDHAMPGGSPLIRPTKVYMVVGEPIRPPVVEGRVPRRVVEELTEELRQALQVVFDEAQQLAGRPARPRPEEADTSGE